MHVEPQWTNKQLYPLLVDQKRGEPNMIPRLTALVKRVAELRAASLWTCHCAEEFTLRWICPLGRRERLALDCPRLADPRCETAADKMFNLYF
jgi:hypothetical protein